jgi:hypothetical protein
MKECQGAQVEDGDFLLHLDDAAAGDKNKRLGCLPLPAIMWLPILKLNNLVVFDLPCCSPMARLYWVEYVVLVSISLFVPIFWSLNGSAAAYLGVCAKLTLCLSI